VFWNFAKKAKVEIWGFYRTFGISRSHKKGGPLQHEEGTPLPSTALDSLFIRKVLISFLVLVFCFLKLIKSIVEKSPISDL
jgi:hypothetical protein